jgi:hypothetical protein
MEASMSSFFSKFDGSVAAATTIFIISVSTWATLLIAYPH